MRPKRGSPFLLSNSMLFRECGPQGERVPSRRARKGLIVQFGAIRHWIHDGPVPKNRAMVSVLNKTLRFNN